MLKIILRGCNGRMGQTIVNIVKEMSDLKIVAGFDINAECKNDFPVFASCDEFTDEADVIIDFSNPNGLDTLIDYAVKRSLPIVVATTGLDDNLIQKIDAASKKIPVFRSFNMSLGINLLLELVNKAAKVLGDTYDIEIIEQHHNQKLDAPSGTALMIAESIASSVDFDAEFAYDRHSVRRKRDKNEIGIHTLRGGTIVGEHEVMFAGHDEIISISHSARSREIFASGSIKAAIFLNGKKPGLYSMKELVSEIN